MIAFIEQEAKEKAEEIESKGELQFMAEKLNFLKKLTQEVQDEFDKKRKEKLTEKKIERSKKLNEARFTSMEARNVKINVLKQEVLTKLADVSKSPQYRELLKYLITQGLIQIQETNVIIQCRKEDEKLVKGLLEESVAFYNETLKAAIGGAPPVKVTLNTENYLPAAPSGNPGASCCGGVVLSARDGQIVCRNTLDSRLELVFDQLRPQIRGILFGVRPKAVVKAKPQAAHH